MKNRESVTKGRRHSKVFRVNRKGHPAEWRMPSVRAKAEISNHLFAAGDVTPSQQVPFVMMDK